MIFILKILDGFKKIDVEKIFVKFDFHKFNRSLPYRMVQVYSTVSWMVNPCPSVDRWHSGSQTLLNLKTLSNSQTLLEVPSQSA